MTDEQIEKAIGLCVRENFSCLECPYLRIGITRHNCRNELIRDMSVYINRFKAENKQIRKETAKEILKALRPFTTFTEEEYKEVAKKYGVEVEE